MMLFVIQLAPFINKDRSRRGTHRRLPELQAWRRKLTAHKPSPPENDSAAEASKQAANLGKG